MPVLRCYGRRFGKLAECKACEARRECSHAGDPPLLSYRNTEDMPDILVEDTEQPGSGIVLEQVRRVLIVLGEAAQCSPTLCYIVVRRLAGVSCREIGGELQISKEAVIAHLRKVREHNPALAGCLVGNRLDEDMAGARVKEARLAARTEADYRRHTRWLHRKNRT